MLLWNPSIISMLQLLSTPTPQHPSRRYICQFTSPLSENLAFSALPTILGLGSKNKFHPNRPSHRVLPAAGDISRWIRKRACIHFSHHIHLVSRPRRRSRMTTRADSENPHAPEPNVAFQTGATRSPRTDRPLLVLP